MGTVSTRMRTVGDGTRRFDVRYRRAGRYTKVEHGGTFKTKKEAQTRARLISEWVASGKDPRAELQRVVAGGQVFRSVHTDWLASRRNVSEGTLAGYRSREPVILDAFGSRAVDQITVRDVIAWVGTLADDLKAGTINSYVAQLRMAIDFSDVAVNVARDRRVVLPRRERKEPVPPTADEFVAILDRVAVAARLPIVAMEQLGSRVSETVALTGDDIDVEGGRVRFRRESTKTKKGRWVDAPDWLLEALAAGVPIPMDRNDCYGAMRGTGFHPHDLRHRRASLWHQQGVVATELARRLGHARASMSLDVYQTVMPLVEVDPEVIRAKVA